METTYFSKPSFVKGYALQSYFPAEEGIITAKLNNYDYWYIDGSLVGEDPRNWENERVNNILKTIAQCNVKPIFHGNYKVPLACDVVELRMAAVEYTKKEIDLAAKLNCPIIIHGGAIVEPRLIIKAKAQALRNYLDSIKRLIDYSMKLNVDIYLENLSNYMNYNPFHYIFTHEEEFQYILESTNLSLFFDLGHSNVCGGDPISVIEKFSHRIVGMSFSNNNGKSDQHLGINNGLIDYKAVIKKIQDCNWSGLIGFETRDRTPKNTVTDLVKLYYESEVIA